MSPIDNEGSSDREFCVLARQAGHAQAGLRRSRSEDCETMVVRSEKARAVVQLLVCGCSCGGVDGFLWASTEYRRGDTSV